MDGEVVQQLIDFKVNNKYPEGLNKHLRYVIKRRASNFVLQGK